MYGLNKVLQKRGDPQINCQKCNFPKIVKQKNTEPPSYVGAISHVLYIYCIIITQWSIAVAWSMFRWQPRTSTSLILPCVTHTHAMQPCQLCTGDPVFLAQVNLFESIWGPQLTSLILPCSKLCTGDPVFHALVQEHLGGTMGISIRA